MRKVIFSLVLILIFLIPWEDMVTIKSLGSLVRLSGLLVVVLWVFTIILTGKFHKPHNFHIIAFVFFLWNVASLFWSFGFSDSIVRIRTYSQLFIFMIILWDVLRKPCDLIFAMQAYIFGAWVAITNTLFHFMKGEEFRIYSIGRYSATGVNPVDLAVILSIGIPLAWYIVVFSREGQSNGFLKLINFAYIPASILSIALTASRTGIITFLPALLYIFLTSHRLKLHLRMLAFITIFLIILALIPYLPQPTIERLSTTVASISSADLGGRVFIWKTALSYFVDKPIIGIGSGAFAAIVDFKSVVHNTYLSILVEVGLIGLILFCIILLIVIYNAISQSRQLAKLWLSVLAIWALGAFSLTWERNKQTWLILSFVIISSHIFRNNGDSAE
jgi:O-antigen ligase